MDSISTQCSVHTCTASPLARTLCNRHYIQARKGLLPLPTKPSRRQDARARFDSSHFLDAHSGCWIWAKALRGSKNGRGQYGGFWMDGKTHLAHIVSWEFVHGSVPEGLQLDHLCRNQRCVNPDHLEPVTALVNQHRQMTANGVLAARSACSQGHEFTEANTYRLPSRPGTRRCKTCRRAVQSESRQRKRAYRT